MQETKREMYKISATMINSYLNMLNKTYSDSEESFLRVLRREPMETNYFINRGNAFEKAVVTYKTEPFYNTLIDCDKNVYIEKEVDFPDEEFDIVLLGYIDFISKDRKIIYDTKRVQSWTDDKYEQSVQHDFYLWAVPESEEFRYMVGSGKKWISDEYFEVLHTKDSNENLELKFRELTNSLLNYLKENNLMDDYKKNHRFIPKDQRKNKKKKGDDN